MKDQGFFGTIGVVLFLASGFSAHATPEVRSIVAVEEGAPDDPSSDHLLMYSDGSVEFLKNREKGRLRRIQSELRNRVREPLPGDTLSAPFEAEYEPSVIEPQKATEIFSTMSRRTRSRSQCYNRALIWGYDAQNAHQLKSMKVFMFFTAKYIREFRYRWWFHAAPYTLVQTATGPEERVLDRQFMRGPVDMKTWSDYFIYPKKPCPTVERYKDYSERQYDQYCYFIKVPMYYWQPRDIEARDQGRPHALEFISSEVRYAYWQAFR